MTEPTIFHVRPAKTQINLGIHPVWSISPTMSAFDPIDFSPEEMSAMTPVCLHIG